MGWFTKKHKVKKGDVVVCIDDRDWNIGNTTIILVYNKKYKLVDVLSSCHGYVYDIGGRIIDTSKSLYTSCSCRANIPGANIHWAGSFRFRIATEEEVEEFETEEISKDKEKFNEKLEAEDDELSEKLEKELEKIL